MDLKDLIILERLKHIMHVIVYNYSKVGGRCFITKEYIYIVQDAISAFRDRHKVTTL